MTSLANHYGSDKGTEGPDLTWGSTSNYTDIYEAYLWPQRHQPIRLLEIGMGVAGDAWDARIVRGRNAGGGASIKMWADYFPQAHIYGIDVNAAPHLDTDRITTFVADQSDTEALGKVVEGAGSEPFDVIVDDGSHFHNHQQISFGYLFEHLKPGGLYFIEDISFTNDTRRVFNGYLETGAFATPNFIGDDTAVAGAIDWVHFHAPALMTDVKVRRSIRQPVRIRAKFRPDSERLCVIRKRD
jgi:hypothetical protein